jgi:hypothetical protein
MFSKISELDFTPELKTKKKGRINWNPNANLLFITAYINGFAQAHFTNSKKDNYSVKMQTKNSGSEHQQQSGGEPSPVDGGRWVCTYCGTKNPVDQYSCSKCKRMLP